MSNPPEQPRQPRNLQDVLRYCGEVNEMPNSQTPQSQNLPVDVMTEERRVWLREALKDMSDDHITAMKSYLATIQTDSVDCDEKLTAIEDLTDLCSNIDFAMDYQKIGGYSVLDLCFTSTHSDIRASSCELAATLLQNNPYCQEKALDSGWVKVFLTMVDKDENDSVRVKALYGTSCLIRSNPAATKEFVNLDGFSYLIRAMHSGVPKLNIKATFLLKCLITDQPELKDTVCNIGMVDQLVGSLKTEHTDVDEHYMSALLSLITDHQSSINECRKPELRLFPLLIDRVKLLEGKEEFLEEKEYAKQILNICFPSREPQEDR